MNGDQILTLIGVVVAALVIGIAVWRYSKFQLKLRVPLGNAELTGERESKAPATDAGFSLSQGASDVRTSVHGHVVGSTVLTAGGSIAEATTLEDGKHNIVRSEIDGSVIESRVETAGGDLIPRE